MNNLKKTQKCPRCEKLYGNSAQQCEICQIRLVSIVLKSRKITKNFIFANLLDLSENINSWIKKLSVDKKSELLKPINIVGISVVLFGTYLWFNRLSQKPVVEIEEEVPEIALVKEVARVGSVPSGIFSYAGEGYFAAFLQQLQENITLSFPDFEIEYTAPTNGDPSHSVAIEMLVAGEVDFVFNGRALNPAEENRARLQGLRLYSQAIARDGIAFYYGEELGINKLTLEQIQAIFRGTVSNWQQLGGRNLPIIPIVLAEENIGDLGFEIDERQSNIKYVANHTIAAREVIKTPGAFSYASAPLLKNQSLLNFFALEEVSRGYQQQLDYIAPFKENGQVDREAFMNGSYPLTRRLFIVYSDRQHSRLAGAAMSNFILSSQGQLTLEGSGFIPLRR